MNNLTFTISLTDEALVTIIESAPSDDPAHLIEDYIEESTAMLRASGGASNWTPDEIATIVGALKSRLSGIKESPVSVDIVNELERRILEASTPDVARTANLVDENEIERVDIERSINLFSQNRFAWSNLLETKPDDSLLLAISKRPAFDMAQEQVKIAIAATEIVYSHLPVELWSSAKAIAQIAALTKLHKE